MIRSRKPPTSVPLSTMQAPAAILPPPKARAASPSTPTAANAPIVIGSSIEIKGELRVDGDLLLEGKVEGLVVVGKHSLTVGRNARLIADLQAGTVRVLGTVVGRIAADRRVEIEPSASVEGEVHAPQVAIADGSSFKGSINNTSLQRKAS